MFLFIVINRSVAGLVCPVVGVVCHVAGAHCPLAGVILTVVEKNYTVAVVACPVARVMQNLCSTSDLKVHSDWVIGRLPFCLQNRSGDCCSPRQCSRD